MSNKFVEVAIRTGVDSGEILARIEEEALGSWEDNGVLHLYWAEERWSPAILEDLKRVLDELGVDGRETDLTVHTIEDRDWNEAWAASLRPVRIGKRIRIRQSWNPGDPRFEGIELVIDPRRAFGAGYHATTQMILEWLEDRVGGGERLLDIGTGTGILGMAALRLGAASVLGIDNDSDAIECAGEYAEVNGFGPELELRIASFESGNLGRFDLVVANLDIRAMPSLCGLLPDMLNAGAAACLSGLQIEDYEETVEALVRAGMEVVSRMEREEWLALEVRRKG